MSQITIKDVLSAGELEALNAAFDANQHLSEDDENHGPLQRDGHNSDGMTAFHDETQRRQVFWGMLEWEKPFCQPFRDLLCHPKIIPYLNTMMGPGWKMDHSPFMLCGGEGSTGLTLHGGTARNPFQVNGYAYANDRMSCGMVVVAFQLHDVNAGDGGLAVVPGSHKSNFPMPPGLQFMEAETDMIHNPAAKAGDVVIFLGKKFSLALLATMLRAPCDRGDDPRHDSMVEPAPRAPLAALSLHVQVHAP